MAEVAANAYALLMSLIESGGNSILIRQFRDAEYATHEVVAEELGTFKYNEGEIMKPTCKCTELSVDPSLEAIRPFGNVPDLFWKMLKAAAKTSIENRDRRERLLRAFKEISFDPSTHTPFSQLLTQMQIENERVKLDGFNDEKTKPSQQAIQDALSRIKDNRLKATVDEWWQEITELNAGNNTLHELCVEADKRWREMKMTVELVSSIQQPQTRSQAGGGAVFSVAANLANTPIGSKRCDICSHMSQTQKQHYGGTDSCYLRRPESDRKRKRRIASLMRYTEKPEEQIEAAVEEAVSKLEQSHALIMPPPRDDKRARTK